MSLARCLIAEPFSTCITSKMTVILIVLILFTKEDSLDTEDSL